MKKVLLILTVLCVQMFAKFETIEVDQNTINDQNIQIIDVRTPAEWEQTGVLNGAILVTYRNSDGSINPNFVNEVKSKIDPNKKVAVICRSGARSKAASTLLDENGVDGVINLGGGMNKVLDKKLPTVKP
ncbi:rhodanese-like domain-containing protein [Campylobacter hyointestinalis]|uniref:Thiosulfate sulfurtransferase n=1 Tax=Campylobacter hyointestinalis subsp. hyointestinalis TaxID=91352 RepID=A0A855N6M4_CAMHY|nr:rhodanese-like domain-containing protein [Campylobacter hyointestinalis]ANE32486.1 putative rhodanese-related sulfurtransferase [Campylobacter hyointestinalis subsp. hyointestinalis LMG 9260]MBT0611553.1 rhodanese-like domain-containing protein [Campylobacter hyointestinalis subsp. hyointestinalis]MDL2346947.1 rhodanese-like domain-containing protein [Campylobacter hyointestinalis]MDL2348441.1 rhodanese-like domain-containing protein [Campylobacter hyointestinalis]MDL2350434.1 rhodanese-lik